MGFEPTISAGERPKVYALDRAATGTDDSVMCCIEYRNFSLLLDVPEKNIELSELQSLLICVMKRNELVSVLIVHCSKFSLCIHACSSVFIAF